MISTRRIIRWALAPLLMASFAACGSGDSSSPGSDDAGNNPPPPPAANSVNVRNNFFDPSSRTVSNTTTVTWTWRTATTDPYTGETSTTSHSVTFDDGVGSSLTQSGGTHTRQFNQTGTFGYFCSVHGAAVMSGTVVVQ